MKPKKHLATRIADIAETYRDDDLMRCAIEVIGMRDELQRTRWDRAREWTLLAFIGAWGLHTIWAEVAKWL